MPEDSAGPDRLQPSLLDRLTDDSPDEQVESRDRRILSMARLRAALLRDLSWLLNTGHLEMVEDLDDFPEVRRSVLNYGIPDLAGMTVSGTSTVAVEKAVRQAIIAFEPRIDTKTLRVTVAKDPDEMNRNALVFRIEGDLWARPTPQALYLKTEVDLDTGDISVNDSRS